METKSKYISDVESPYINLHWNEFSKIPYESAGAIGKTPRDWALSHKIEDTRLVFSDEKRDRASVRAICQDPSTPVLQGYVEVMAWGSQGSGPGGSRNVLTAWKGKEKLERKINIIRDGGLNRREAYSLFLNEGKVTGLGPAYWTKLLYFFSPDPSFYIMDQWTGKSINLLTGYHLVRMQGDALCSKNKPGNYQVYCEEVDKIAEILGIKGEQAEEMLMSKGGRNPKPWRSYVKSKTDYDPAFLAKKYPHIARDFF